MAEPHGAQAAHVFRASTPSRSWNRESAKGAALFQIWHEVIDLRAQTVFKSEHGLNSLNNHSAVVFNSVLCVANVKRGIAYSVPFNRSKEQTPHLMFVRNLL